MPLPLLLPKRPMDALGLRSPARKQKEWWGEGKMWTGEVDEADPAARVVKKGRFYWLTRGPAVGGRHK